MKKLGVPEDKKNEIIEEIRRTMIQNTNIGSTVFCLQSTA
jgi:hypothetical protein